MGEEAPETRTQLAEERTEWANERTLLAKERTFAAWMRTGLAAVAAGLGATRLLVQVEPQWLVTALGAGLVMTGAGALLLGFWSYRKTFEKLKEKGVHGIPTWLVALFTLGLLASAAAGLVLVLLNRSV